MCAKAEPGNSQARSTTSWQAAVITEATFVYALGNGLQISALNGNLTNFVDYLSASSVEPIAVTTVARVRGMLWDPIMCEAAALHGRLAYLQWLRASGCPLALEVVLQDAARESALKHAHAEQTLEIVQWLMTDVSSKLDTSVSPQKCFEIAATTASPALLEWFREEYKLLWPSKFRVQIRLTESSSSGQITQTIHPYAWAAGNVEYALQCGSGWGEWCCADFHSARFSTHRRQLRHRCLDGRTMREGASMTSLAHVSSDWSFYR